MADYVGYLAPNKTATTSMTQAFVDAGLLHKEWIWDIPCNGFFKPCSYVTGPDWIHRRWWEPQNDNIILFSVIRNPWDRLVSGWLQSRRSEWVRDDMSLKEFCELLNTIFWEGITTEDVTRFRITNADIMKTAYRHAMNLESGIFLENPQQNPITARPTDFPLNLRGGEPAPARFIKACAVKGYKLQPNIKYLLSFENLEEELNTAFDDLNIQNVKLPRLRVDESKKDYRSYYCNETVDFATEYYAWEIELGNYSFG